MTTITSPTEITRYLDQVRELLADLPADEREELLDDLAVHLHEVRAETDEPLEQALGTPVVFVAELLSSSGHAGEIRRSGLWPPVPSSARHRWERLQATDAYRWLEALRPELVPGWWVLRGYLGVLVVSEVMNGVSGDDFPIPSLLGSKLVGLVAVAAAMVGSVHLGRRCAEGRGPRGVGLLNIAVVVGALWGGLIAFDARATEYVYFDDVHSEPSVTGVLTQPDGTTITNLFAYDAEGRLLDGVLLYDQNGNPVEVTGDEGSAPYTDDGIPVETDYRLDVNGAEVRNAFPLEQRVEEWRNGPDGSERVMKAPVRPPAITTPRLAGGEETSTPSTSTTSTSITTSTSVPPQEPPVEARPATRTRCSGPGGRARSVAAGAPARGA